MQITAIILAGGKSKRMGRDKALLDIEGKSLLERSISLCEIVCNKILISSNNSIHSNFGYPVISDEIPNCGPIGGIYSCLKKSDTNWNFVISVDAAFVESGFIEFLISVIENVDAVVPFSEKGKEPLIALYNKSSLPVMEEKLAIGDFKMHNLLNAINTKFVDAQNWIDKYPSVFKNLNYPKDI
jgi:molybdopterin-guanine dinucleotide biosynthesis protein A